MLNAKLNYLFTCALAAKARDIQYIILYSMSLAKAYYMLPVKFGAIERSSQHSFQLHSKTWNPAKSPAATAEITAVIPVNSSP